MPTRDRGPLGKLLFWIRLSLGGTVLGLALAPLAGPLLGLHDSTALQSFGALSGTAVAAVAVKLTHLV